MTPTKTTDQPSRVRLRRLLFAGLALAAVVLTGALAPVGASADPPAATTTSEKEDPVSASQRGPWTVGVSSLPAVSGTMSISGTPTVAVAGTPSVSIAGTPTVNVANFPAGGGGAPTTSLLWAGNICGDTNNGGTYGSPAIDVSGSRTVRVAFTPMSFQGASEIEILTADIAPFILFDEFTINDDFSKTYDVLGQKISLGCGFGAAPSVYFAAVWGRP